jgi:hypothetical protein
MNDGAAGIARDPTEEIAAQLRAANEQLVVAALRSENRSRPGVACQVLQPQLDPS